MISFCITCHKRQWQLEQTLPSNLALARQFGYEICLVNYGAIKELDIYIEENFSGDREDKVLRYYSTPAPRFHASHAKNIAHLLGTRDIVFNLDADNYITSFHQTIYKLLSENPNVVVHNWSGSYVDGTYGRIGMTKKNFEELGGYDERFKGVTWQDVDLLMRVNNRELSYHLLPFFHKSLPIPNTQREKIRYTNSPHDYTTLYLDNFHLLEKNRWRGVVRANEGELFGLSKGVLVGTGLCQTGFQSGAPWVRPLTGIYHFCEDIFEKIYWTLLHPVFTFLYWKGIHPILTFLYWKGIHPILTFLYWKGIHPILTFLYWKGIHPILAFLYWKGIHLTLISFYRRKVYPALIFCYWKGIHFPLTFLYWKIIHPALFFFYRGVLLFYWKISYPLGLFFYGRIWRPLGLFFYWKIFYRLFILIRSIGMFFYWKVGYRLYCVIKHKIVLRILRIGSRVLGVFSH